MNCQPYPKYKDSGVDWIGEIPEGWEVKPMRHLCTVTTGDKDTVDAVEDGDYPFFVRSQTVERIDSYTFDGECVLTAGDGVGVGKVFHYSQGKIDFHQRVYLMSNFRGIYGRFFFLYLKELFAKVALDGGAKSTVDSLRRPVFLGFQFSVPPPFIQQSILKALDRETTKIDTLIRYYEDLTTLLTEKRQALVSHAVTRGLSELVDANDPEFGDWCKPVRFRDSGVEWLGEIPEGWETKRVGTLYSESSVAGDDSLPILSVSIHSGVSDKELNDVELDRKVSRSEDKEKYKRVRPNDLTYNMMRAWQGGFGAVSVDGMVSPAYVVANPKRDLDSRYFEAVLRCPNIVERMRVLSRGVTDFRLRLYWDEFRTLLVPVPATTEQGVIMKFLTREITKIDSLIRETQDAIELLKEHRSALITAAVTGKINVESVS